MGKKNNRLIEIINLIFIIVLIALNLALGAGFSSFKDFIDGLTGDNQSFSIIIKYIKVPRIIACILVGAGLSVAGLLLQSMLNNSLASPATLGINSGAGLMVIIFSVFVNGSSIGLTIATFLGAFLSALLIYLIARATGASRNKLVLAGIALSRLFSAIIDSIIYFYPQGLVSKQSFQLGSFSKVNIESLYFAGGLILIGLIASIIISRYLGVLSLGDEVATSLGMNVKTIRFIILVIVATLASGSVAIAGLLSFLGLIVPHLVRRLIGNENPKRQIVLCMLIGANLTLACDLISRIIMIPYEPPVGIFMSILGIPFFILLLFKKGENFRFVKNK